ncbi:MAG: hypothetical protein ABSG07_07970 [Terriglobales bacterium]|jgi:hypothetical protein
MNNERGAFLRSLALAPSQSAIPIHHKRPVRAVTDANPVNGDNISAQWSRPQNARTMGRSWKLHQAISAAL